MDSTETLGLDAGRLCVSLARRRTALRSLGHGQLQSRVVKALSRVATNLLSSPNPLSPADSRAQGPNEAAWISLKAMLASWNESALWSLIDSEGARAPDDGPSVVLHVVAANTPLLAWSSVARSLLVEAASIVRLPSDAPNIRAWADVFVKNLSIVDSELAELVELVTWPSSDLETTRSYCLAADAVLVYGSDETVAQFAELVPAGRRLLGYGDMLSFGLVLPGSDLDKAASGCALDIALFDQEGCLSPQMIFVIGDSSAVSGFCSLLYQRLADLKYLASERSVGDAVEIRDAAAIAQFEIGVEVMQDWDLSFTVLRHADVPSSLLRGRGVVHIVEADTVKNVVSMVRNWNLEYKVQGVSIAGPNTRLIGAAATELEEIRVSYVCDPGRLQTPPFEWRENGLAVLSSLISD